MANENPTEDLTLDYKKDFILSSLMETITPKVKELSDEGLDKVLELMELPESDEKAVEILKAIY